MTNLYQVDSFATEDDRTFTRRAPATYLGSAKNNSKLADELLANSIDEHSIGHGDKIIFRGNSKTNEYLVEDNGQGFPINEVGVNRLNGETFTDGKTILQRMFDTMNSSGKSMDNGVYTGNALGLNGIGAKLANWLSLKMTVTSYQNGQYETVTFKDGLFESRDVGKAKHPSGTVVKYSPDPQFFNENVLDATAFKNKYSIISAFCPDLTIDFEYDGVKEVFHEPNGLEAFVAKRVEGSEIFPTRFATKRTIGEDTLDIVITFTSDNTEHIDGFVNLGATTGGAHIGAFHSSFVKAVNKCATELGLLKKSDRNFNNSEITKGLYVVFNMTTSSVKYEAQNKNTIDDIDASVINGVIGGDFATWLMNNQNCLKIITDKALVERKVLEAQKKVAEQIRDTGKGKGTKALFSDLPTKLSDAYPKNKKDRSCCELLICEGDSAAASINAVKDSNFQATFPIRGKILNCRGKKATSDKVLGNDEIKGIISSLGLAIDKDTHKLIYDEKKLRFNKIIITTDADADGSHIASLLCTVFDRLCPELFTNGHIYRVFGALYRATFSDGTYKLFQNDAELNAWRKTNKKNYTLARAKGLGEMTEDETYEQLLNPATRNLVRLVVSDYANFEKYLEIFEGEDDEMDEIKKQYYETGELPNV